MNVGAKYRSIIGMTEDKNLLNLQLNSCVLEESLGLNKHVYVSLHLQTNLAWFNLY